MNPEPESASATCGQTNDDLRRQLAEARAERDEALAREAAMAEVLGVINSSPGDLAPVFDAMLDKALRLCEATFGGLATYDGEFFRQVAARNDPQAFREALQAPWRPPPQNPSDRLTRGAALVHIPDVTADETYVAGDPQRRSFAVLTGARTAIWVALRKDDKLLGFIAAYRTEVRPFTDKQIALLQNFAAQAVIAMENARLLTETREALEQQTATAEVLQVINSSPGNLTPVFDAMLERAMQLCGASFGGLGIWQGQRFTVVAARGVPRPFADFLAANEVSPGPRSGFTRVASGDGYLQSADLAESKFYTASESLVTALVDLGGARTSLIVPLAKDDEVLGILNVYRQEVRPFTDKQIALLQNFAAQAVIAMENARLLTETREALEQQTATAEVLQVINSSPGDLPPVFAAMLQKATTLCSAHSGFLWTFDGGRYRAAATLGLSPSFAEFLSQPRVPGPETGIGRLARGEALVHFDDLAAVDAYRRGDELHRASVDLGGFRTVLVVPLRKDGSLLGGFTIERQEVRPFTDKQIALVQNFAAQAVIAIENARLLGELRERTRDLEESLEYQTATSDVLKVISQSTFDLGPVLEYVIETALRLCRAHMGSIFRLNDGVYRWAVGRGLHPAYQEIEQNTPILPGRGTLVGRVAVEGRAVQIADAEADPSYAPKDDARIARARTMLGVPLLRAGVPIGVIAMARDRVEPFNDREIALVSTFADQAVIAIENVRLFDELRARTRDLEESLEYQTATSDVLKVISRSTFDLQRVLQTLVETAARLCGAEMAISFRREGELWRLAASYGFSPEYVAYWQTLGAVPYDAASPLVGWRCIGEARTVHIHDALAIPGYPEVVSRQARTALGVPLLREGEVIGNIVLARQRAEPFIDRQIELVRTFADQAVIAIENARLLSELRESLEQQQAIAEVLQVINSSPGNLQPVFEVILEKAHNLCGVAYGSLELYDGHNFCSVAERGLSDEFASELRQGYPAHLSPASRPLVEGERVSHIADAAQIDHPIFRSAAQRAGIHTVLFVPLRRDEALLGMIASARREVRPFSEKEIALLESFAAQAVIAMDNARLLGEIRQRQAELRVTFDNMGDGVAMFGVDLRLAAWNRNFQQILDLPDEFLAERPSVAEYFRHLAERGEYPGDLEAELRRTVEDTAAELRFERTRPDGRVVEVRRNAVPGGGFVLIYGDITERKRAEAEIRAARDAAETALGELRATQQQLVVQQKMAALGQLTAGIAHEIKNPLNFVNNFAGLSAELLDELKAAAAPGIATLDDDTRTEIDDTIEMLTSNLDKISEHGRRADGIVQSMLQHSRGGSGDWQECDINALVDEALNLAYHGARAQDQSFNITMERNFDRTLAPIEVVPQDVTRVFLNLIGNGFYAATKKGREADGGFRPLLRVTTRALRNAVEVRVRDNGTGIAPEHRDKLFQPFFTTKPTGEGTGLGLSISHDIVTTQHGGTITVDSEVSEFTEFIVRLPRHRHAATPGRGDDRQHPDRRR